MKSIKINKLALSCSLLPLALLSAGSHATELDAGVYIAPSLSYHTFGQDLRDDGFTLDNTIGAAFGLGYQFEENWAVEIAYHLDKETEDDHGNDADSGYVHFDGLYHFDNDIAENWSPYAVAGLGVRTYEIDAVDYKDFDIEFNAGAGLKYVFNSNFYFRTDVRLTYGAYDNDIGSLWNVGIVYIFGGSDFAKNSKYSLNDSLFGNKDKKSKPEEETPVVESEPITESEPAVEPAVVSAAAIQAAKTVATENIIDTDNDGVADEDDKCPDTLFGAKVDETGCYSADQDKEVEFKLNVTFKSGSTWLDKLSRIQIDELAHFLTVHNKVDVVIEGHSDSQGPDDMNKRLSQGRADSVVKYLIENHKIPASQITAIGYGEDKPIADNNTAEGRAENRRVMAKVTAKAK